MQELRDLTRTRQQLVRALGQHVQRIEKVLEDANLKLTGVLTDVVGASGRRMLDALIAGETDAAALAALASPRVKASPAELREALRGRVTPHHRSLLREHLTMVDHLRERIAVFDAQIGAVLEPFRAAADRLVSIPGVSEVLPIMWSQSTGAEVMKPLATPVLGGTLSSRPARPRVGRVRPVRPPQSGRRPAMQKTGDVIVTLKNDTGQWKQGQNTFVLEITSAKDQTPVDAGKITLTTSMPMPGMAPMIAGAALTPDKTPGRYTGTIQFPDRGARQPKSASTA